MCYCFNHISSTFISFECICANYKLLIYLLFLTLGVHLRMFGEEMLVAGTVTFFLCIRMADGMTVLTHALSITSCSVVIRTQNQFPYMSFVILLVFFLCLLFQFTTVCMYTFFPSLSIHVYFLHGWFLFFNCRFFVL